MLPNSISVRVMFPHNYVQSSAVPVIVLIDSVYAHIPLSSLKLNISIPAGNCQSAATAFQSSLTLSCTFPSPTTAILSVDLYHNNYPTVKLASAQNSIPILTTPSNNCNNQMCDSCSPYNGQ